MANDAPQLVELDSDERIWDRFFTVYPLVIIGTEEEDGSYDLAPKHLAMPLSWEAHFGFVCTPRHRTYQNIQRTGEFCVTYPRPSQIVLASLAASPRCEDDSKPIVDALPTLAAESVAGAFLEDGYAFLECRCTRIYDDFGENSLIAGEVIGARVAEDALKHADEDDQDLIAGSPLLAYLYPGRFAEISNTNRLPFPAGFKR
ncbi:MAG TPA: flavin reductase [Gammaproteobacteria bacterium]|jgi:flavin reductase (DIM6/NTAB) family NADH-FMN oxidoreductase RutF